MDANRFGKNISWTTFGESHGPSIGVVIEGLPAGIAFDEKLLHKQLARRRPGQSEVVSARDEADIPQILSGVFEGKTLGTPIAVIVNNNNVKSQDYDAIKNNPRIGHADQVWKEKFQHVDHRGGGRSSGRETLARVIAGSFCEMYLHSKLPKVEVVSFTSQIGEHNLTTIEMENVNSREQVDTFVTRFPSAEEMLVKEKLLKAKAEGESFGGVVTTKIKNLPLGVGEPVFYKLKSQLALAMMSIGATQGFEIGNGFDSIKQKGTVFHSDKKNYGGMSGGMSNGDEILFHVGFKPTSSILDVAKQGRHDPCIVPRACVVVEAMTWSVLADLISVN